MPSSLASHLLEQFYAVRQARAPFGQPINPSQLVLSGPMSYAPQMHGNFPIQQPFLDQSCGTGMNVSMFGGADLSGIYTDMAESTAQKIAQLQAKLDKKLGPEYISQRPGPGGGVRLTYAEGWKIINLANEVFGFNGWSSSVVNLNTDFVDYDGETRRYSVGVSAVIRVTLRDGVFHEDVGYGVLENSKSKGAALDKCKKEAVTDGVKRALRNFGNLLGNCLYDKQYAQEIVKMKVPPTKFDKNALHRRPEFQEGSSTASDKPNIATSNTSAPPNANPASKPPVPFVLPKAIGVNSFPSHVSPNMSMNNSNRPPSAIPAHVLPVAMSTPLRNTTPEGGAAVKKDGGGTAPPKPQAPSAAFRPAPVVNSAKVDNKASDQVPKTSSTVQHTRPKPKPLQAFDRADTYSFSSDDDDEFIAALEKLEGDAMANDLAADIGRPIQDDEGIGSAIDFDEGATCDMAISPSNSGDEETLVNDKPSDGRRILPKALVQHNKPAQPAAKAVNPYSALVRQPVPPARSGIMQPREIKRENVPHAISPEDEIARQIVAMRQQRKVSMGTSNTAPAGNQNALPKVDQNIAPPRSKHPTTSMGGFVFPPGLKHSAGPLSSAVRQSQPVSIQAGTKRKADAMNEVSSGGGPISYANVQAAAQSRAVRQPFARLDDPEGGDVKRIRT